MITSAKPKDINRKIQLQAWEKVWEEYFKEKNDKSDEWRVIWKLVAQAIVFEKVLINNIAQSEDEADTQSAIT